MTDSRPGPATAPWRIIADDLTGPAITALLTRHRAQLADNSPACGMHALDLSALRDPTVTVWSAWSGTDLVGCGALREIDPAHGEIKSMRTADGYTGRGVGAAVLAHLVGTARQRGYRRLSLETGSGEFFAPARRLYRRHGFTECGPFAEYLPDPFSRFYTLELE
ncbi:GNAT family N-acetyltransferase [Nocardia sp. SSK8]|uniref:GNAT family N-acetyltransferase n=1 Tax=Nocardia sp. SSK8 TaxID=3120154 RepID=UPI00300B8404